MKATPRTAMVTNAARIREEGAGRMGPRRYSVPFLIMPLQIPIATSYMRGLGFREVVGDADAASTGQEDCRHRGGDDGRGNGAGRPARGIPVAGGRHGRAVRGRGLWRARDTP